VLAEQHAFCLRLVKEAVVHVLEGLSEQVLNEVLVSQIEARRRGYDPSLVTGALVTVAICAVIGARLYHVIDQWDRYRDNLLAIVLPPYSGLGVYGGIVTGFAAGILYARWKRQPILSWVDVAAPGMLTMQAVGRWGNFFNQVYGRRPPPWGSSFMRRGPRRGTPAPCRRARRHPLPASSSTVHSAPSAPIVLCWSRAGFAGCGAMFPPCLRLAAGGPDLGRSNS
jgi:hypothetical protein